MENCTICISRDGEVYSPCARHMAEEQAEIDAYEDEFYGMMTGAEFMGEMMAAQYDDDPNPYHGTY